MACTAASCLSWFSTSTSRGATQAAAKRAIVAKPIHRTLTGGLLRVRSPCAGRDHHALRKRSHDRSDADLVRTLSTRRSQQKRGATGTEDDAGDQADDLDSRRGL